MSFNRHEDDLLARAYEQDGEVEIVDLIEHLEQIVGQRDVYVARAARTAAYLLRKQGLEGKLDLYSRTKLLAPVR